MCLVGLMLWLAGAGWVLGEEAGRLALNLSNEGRHEAAATEYRRLALAVADPIAAGQWYWWAAHEYARGRQVEASNRMLDRAEDAAPLALNMPVAWLRAENASVAGDWAAARFHYDSLRLAADAESLHETALRGAAAARLREGDADGARQTLAGDGPELVAAREAMAKYAGRRDKKPWVGGVLGLVPGLGYVYSGEYASATRSLILNSLFIWGMVEAADRDLWGVFAVVTFAEMTWYSGSIYGGIDAAHRHNARRLNETATVVRGSGRAAPDMAAWPLVTLHFQY
ncbi:MAG: hypothetical protein GX803_03300 [Lentisphaerae bacterium]|jgi:hypothetical protein|nr:hypothetical protein [Lentisphaerota bacterium]